MTATTGGVAIATTTAGNKSFGIALQAGATGNATVDEQLKVTAQSNELGKIMSVRKLTIREALLAQLEAEFEATKSGN